MSKFEKYKICVKCGTKLRDEAIYCDQCGHFLKFDNSIKLIFPKNKKLENFKKIIKFAMDSLEPSESGGISLKNDVRKYFHLINDYLFELTNLNKILMNNDCSIQEIYYKLPFILFKIKGCHENNILNELLYEINEFILSKNALKEFTQHFIFYTNIDQSKYEDDEDFKKVLSFFDLSIFDFNKFNFDESVDDKIKYKFHTYKFCMIDCCVVGKNINYMKQIATDKIYSFYGYLGFIQNFKIRSERWNINDFDLEFNELDLDILFMLNLKEDYSFDDVKSNFLLLEKLRETNPSRWINFNRAFNVDCYDLLNDSNEDIKKEINEFFKLYYLASFEKSIENSFIKFWSLNEKIIKKISLGGSDDKLLKYMVKILKLYYKNNFFAERIHSIRNKRNKLVHENINELTQTDRNLVKLISDLLIWFLITFSSEVNNMREYQIILDYYNRSNIERNIELMKFASNLIK